MNQLGTHLVASIMSKEVVSVSPNHHLNDIIDLMTKNSFRHVIVTQNGELAGIISKNDIDRFKVSGKADHQDLQKKLVESLTVEQLMTKNVRTVDHDDSIKEAAELLSLSSYHALPVLKDGKLVGIITSTDIILYLLSHCD
ncbi:MAG: CBS domain-containing protein [Saprospiraceae bacterium]|jgi:CBS domain-containing protein